MLATLEGYGLKWPYGADKLLLVSVGTGYRNLRMDSEKVLNMPAVQLAGQSILSIMADCDWLGQSLLQWMSRSPTSWKIDSEIGDLKEDTLGGGQPLLSYLRYNILFDVDWLRGNLNLLMDSDEVDSLFAMDQPNNVKTLANLGATAGLAQVQEEHFPAGFDIE